MKTLKSHIDLLVQAVLWGLMLLIPFLSALSSGATWKDSLWVVMYSVPYFLIYVIIFYVNYLWFIPRFLFRKRYWQMVAFPVVPVRSGLILVYSVLPVVSRISVPESLPFVYAVASSFPGL